MSTICLNMIVRDEAAIIERCLRAAAPFIDCYVILDTGSTDDTIAIIKHELRGIPGHVHRGVFEDFEQARNDALEYAKDSNLEFDYILFCDADMEIKGDPTATQTLAEPAYSLVQRNGTIAYGNTRLVRRDVPARYVGVTHEYLETAPTTPLPEVWFWDHCEGSSRADKFERDIQLLLTAPPTPRNLFYLAQSYRDSNHMAEALEAYQWRVDAGGWDEEVWYSLFQIAELTGRTDDYLAAYQFRSTRAEPLVALARKYRVAGRHHLAYLMASEAVRMELPDDILFVDESCYKWRAMDEAAIAAYWTGRHAECAWRCRTLLEGDRLPESERARVKENLRFAQEALDLVATVRN